MTDYTRLDALAHAHARAKFVATWVRQHDPEKQHRLTRLLDSLERDLAEHAERFGIGNGTHYSTDLPIFTVEKPAAAQDFVWVWHPDPQHESNQPRIIEADADLGNGERGAVIISAPGQIDVVRHKPAADG